jgi:hypothetical protein
MKHLPPLDRRALMRLSVAFGSSVALVGSGAASATAASPTTEVPLTGAVLGWLAIGPDGGGRISVLEVSANAREPREMALEAVVPGTSLAASARQATGAVTRAVAAAWKVSPGDCVCNWGRIDHPASGRSIPFKIWTDFA